MDNLILILFYLWILLTAAIAIIWVLGRIRNRDASGPEADSSRNGRNETERNLSEDGGSSQEDRPMGPTERTETVDIARSERTGADEAQPLDVEADHREVTAPNIEEVLADVRVGYDLIPTNDAVVDPDRHRIFLCRRADAAMVGTALADDLERLGFQIEPVDHDRVVAHRGTDVLTVLMVTSPAAETNQARYPDAATGDVAVEMWLGAAETAPETRTPSRR